MKNSIKFLLFGFVAAFMFASCTPPKDEPTNSTPQVVAAKIMTASPSDIAQEAHLSSFQRGLLAEADSTLPVVVQISFTQPTQGQSVWSWLSGNWWAFLLLGLGIWELFARVTPTEVDNTILAIIKRVLDLLIPNKKTGGNTFTT
jgi:hypothetical protein